VRANAPEFHANDRKKRGERISALTSSCLMPNLTVSASALMAAALTATALTTTLVALSSAGFFTALLTAGLLAALLTAAIAGVFHFVLWHC